MHTNLRDTIVIMKEWNRHHPLCLSCDMLVPWAELNRHHPFLALCAQVEERKIRYLAEGGDQLGSVTAFHDYD